MKSQSDIARENQAGLEKINKRLQDKARPNEDERATRFDGDPQPKDAGGTFKPKDDTPWHLEKRETPKK